MRRLTFAALLLCVPLLACDDDPTEPQQISFSAQLTGENEVPPVATDASGEFAMTFDPADSTFSYTLTVEDITGVTASHIHGPAGTGANAGILVGLETPSGGSSAGTFTGVQASVSATELLALILDGQTYVNVHTTANPGGEIRGQVARD